MKIIVYAGAELGTYVVFIDKKFYHMSRVPEHGINKFSGEFESDDEKIHKAMKYLKLRKLIKIPTSLKMAIRERCKEIRRM